MKIIEAFQREQWNKFVLSSNGSILQSYEWGELKGVSGWQPIRIALFDNGRIVEGVSILKKPVPIPGKCVFYAPRSPILSDELLSHVKTEAKKHGAVYFKIDPPVEESDEVEKLLRKQGFTKKKKQVQPRSTFFLDLTKNLDELLRSFEEKTRYNIRLSERKGVKVKLDNSDKGVEEFCKLYHQTSSRDNFLIHPDKYYQNIKKLLIDKGLASIFLANYQGNPVAGVFMFIFGKKVWYMYGASSNEFRNVMPNHALHWEVIKWAKEKGCETYDLWGIPSKPTEKHPLWGVYRFKKGFKGKLVKYVGVFDLVFDKFDYFVVDQAMLVVKSFISLIKKGKISDSLGE